MPRPKSNLSQTVFVRYSPPNPAVTHTLLTETFSEYGPVKKCSVIRDQKHDDDDDNDNASAARAEDDAKRTRGYGFVRFASPEDALEAVQKLNGTYLHVGEYGDRVKLHVERASDATAPGGRDAKKKTTRSDGEDEAAQDTAAGDADAADGEEEQNQQQFQVDEAMSRRKRTARIILRNLAFSAKASHIRTTMESTFGKEAIVDIHLPLVPGSSNEKNGKGKGKGRGGPMHRGFAFVTFDNAVQAQKAVEMGSLVIKGREVAMDYSVSKFQHKRMAEEHVEEEDEEEDAEEEETEDKNEEEEAEKSDDEDDSSSDSDSDDDSSSDDHDFDDDDDDEESVDKDDGDGGIPKEQHRPKPVNDPRRTLFVRNVPFDATRTDLFETFRHHGRIESIYLVKDRDTGVGKGTAFVRYETEASAKRALEAAGSSSTGGPFVSRASDGGDNSANLAGGQGLYLSGRRLLVDPAVDRDTASSLKVERDEDGKPLERKVGKDKRNLYLTTEGRVASGTDGEPGPWEELPESDRQKRGRAHQEKSSKLRSPLFFINPVRLSFRNLAKHVDEAALKKLAVEGIRAGLEADLVSKEDVLAHWRASGDMTARDIVQKISEMEEAGESIVPPYDEAAGIRRHIPSVYIDRDFAGIEGGKKDLAPSRGFGFVEFTHHAHALACLRELNNNPAYSAEYATGGKKAVEMKKRQRKGKKGKKGMRFDDDAEGGNAADFVGDDGRVRIPRLIVEFTVENKAKAKRQADHRAHQLANAEKQKAASRAAKKERAEEDDPEEMSKSKKKKKGRGALQREKKRRQREEGNETTPLEDTDAKKSKKARKVSHDDADVEAQAKPKVKAVKPPKKRKIDKEEQAFENMVRSYKQAFAGGADDITKDKKKRKSSSVENDTPANPRSEVTKKRWFD